ATASGATQMLPMQGGGWSSGIQIQGSTTTQVTTTFIRVVSPGYLEAVGVKLRDGRMFADADRSIAGTEPAIIVNEALVKKYFPGTNPIGRLVSTGFTNNWGRVIGVVNDVAEGHLADE